MFSSNPNQEEHERYHILGRAQPPSGKPLRDGGYIFRPVGSSHHRCIGYAGSYAIDVDALLDHLLGKRPHEGVEPRFGSRVVSPPSNTR